MSKYYAVKKGKHPGIYQTWPECQREVNGFSGAIYKSFSTLAEAQTWLKNQQTQQHHQQLSLGLVRTSSVSVEQNTRIIRLYTDGGSRNHGNRLGQHVKTNDKAAWAYLIINGRQRLQDTAGEFGATNNRMELMALRNALQTLLSHGWQADPIMATLDSHYVLDPITNGWLYGWYRRGWTTGSGSPVANQKLWAQVLHLLPQFKQLHFNWTKGHADNEGNVIVDHLLNQTMDQMEEE